MKSKIAVVLTMILVGLFCVWMKEMRSEVPATNEAETQNSATPGSEEPKDFIKWVDFKVSYEALCDAYEYDVGSYGQELTADRQYYDSYLEAYTAVLGGLVGEYEKDDTVHYGLRAFSPVAKDFYYTDYDDFGVSRSYGYRRQHLGHDMMGQVGTPIITMESGKSGRSGRCDRLYGTYRL